MIVAVVYGPCQKFGSRGNGSDSRRRFGNAARRDTIRSDYDDIILHSENENENTLCDYIDDTCRNVGT